MSGKPKGPAVRRDCVCPNVTHEHGTVQAYNRDRCRCDACRKAIADDTRHIYRLKTYGRWDGMTPADGARRRLQALATLGWSGPLLSVESGLAGSCINRVRLGRTTILTPTTAAAIRETYDRLWNTRAPHGPGKLRGYNEVLNLARKRGWVGPLAWDDDTIDDPNAEPAIDAPLGEGLDEIAVERFMAGTLRDRSHVAASPERLEAIRRLADYGMADFDIGQRVGMTATNVGQLRLRRGIPTRSPRRGVSGGGGVAA